MSTKSFALSKEDPVVQKFSAGLEAWERPLKAPAAIRVRGAIRTRGKILTRGPLPEERPIRTRGSVRIPAVALPKDDPAVQQFRDGLEDWERPYEKKR